LLGVGDGLAHLVVVVTELLLAEAWAAATAAVLEGVATAVGVRLLIDLVDDVVLHDSLAHRVEMCAKSSIEKRSVRTYMGRRLTLSG
jgi:hypothetical protein